MARTVSADGPHGCHEAFRHGPKSLEHSLLHCHDLHAKLRPSPPQATNNEAFSISDRLGRLLKQPHQPEVLPIMAQHALLRRNLDRRLCNNSRLGGLSLSNLHADVLEGRDGDLDVSDVLDRPMASRLLMPTETIEY